MSIRLNIVVALLLFAQGSAFGIEFYSGTWEETLLKAKESNKLIFVDAYTTWCGPCKLMTKKIFPDPQLSEYYDQNFISVKLDMEKGEGPKIGRKYGVSAYPTLLYIDGSGKLIHKKVGVTQADELISIGKSLLLKYNRADEMRETYETGDNLTPEFMITFLKELNKAGEETTKLANGYLRGNPDIAPDDQALIAFYGMENADSRLFETFTKNYDYILEEVGMEAVEKKMALVTTNTAKAAKKFKTVVPLEALRSAENMLDYNWFAVGMTEYGSATMDEKVILEVLQMLDPEQVKSNEKILAIVAERKDETPIADDVLAATGKKLIKKGLTPEIARLLLDISAASTSKETFNSFSGAIKKASKKSDYREELEAILSKY